MESIFIHDRDEVFQRQWGVSGHALFGSAPGDTALTADSFTFHLLRNLWGHGGEAANSRRAILLYTIDFGAIGEGTDGTTGTGTTRHVEEEGGLHAMVGRNRTDRRWTCVFHLRCERETYWVHCPARHRIKHLDRRDSL